MKKKVVKSQPFSSPYDFTLTRFETFKLKKPIELKAGEYFAQCDGETATIIEVKGYSKYQVPIIGKSWTSEVAKS